MTIDCDYLKRIAHTQQPASLEQIRAAEQQLHWDFPPLYCVLLSCSDGLLVRDGPASLCIYAVSEIAERNATYEVKEYLPSFVMIGDDGGGRGIFLDRTFSESAVYMIDVGSLLLSDASVLAANLTAWISEGFNLTPSTSSSDGG